MDPPITALSPRSYPRQNTQMEMTSSVGPTEGVEKSDMRDMEEMGVENKKGCGWSAKDSVGFIILMTIGIFLIAMVIYVLAKPSFVKTADGTKVDYGKAALAALITSLTAVIIIWMIRSCSRRS